MTMDPQLISGALAGDPDARWRLAFAHDLLPELADILSEHLPGRWHVLPGEVSPEALRQQRMTSLLLAAAEPDELLDAEDRLAAAMELRDALGDVLDRLQARLRLLHMDWPELAAHSTPPDVA